MNEDEKLPLMKALQPVGEPLVVRSTFPLTPAMKADIKKIVTSIAESNPQLEFLTSIDEVGGIELSANGFKIAWNIAGYLDILEKRVAGVTDNLQGIQPEPENISHGS